MKLGILTSFTNGDENYIKACEEMGVEYELLDFKSSNWIEEITASNCDGYLVRPAFQKETWKQLYNERLYILNEIMKKPIYPSLREILLYENKKMMAYWLESNNISHPQTNIFYDKSEALSYLNTCKNYPLVFKTNIGSAAIGVKFVNKRRARSIVNKIFTKYFFYNRGYTKWHKTKFIVSYPHMDDKQYNYVIFQEKINVLFEWRMIKIGESFFGHQKLIKGDFHSGSDRVGWIQPPKKLLDFVKEVCEKGNFSSMDVDIFEDVEGNFYVNELQTIFGSYDKSQMYIEGVPGRYIYKNDDWVFEEGYFNTNGSCNLRVDDFIKKLER